MSKQRTAVILCGGLGTRFSEETIYKPKPMILVGKFPILFHILKIYEKHGINDFILALGYKSEKIKKCIYSYLKETITQVFGILKC